jgi:hypothetical protein
MKSTIAEARVRLEEEVVPRASDYVTNQFRAQLTEAEQQARAVAGEEITRAEQEVAGVRDAALHELADVRDEYEQLASQGSAGRIQAAEYSKRLRDLRRRQQLAERGLEQAEAVVQRAETIEEDPVAYYDGLSQRFPDSMMRNWSW